MTAPMATDTASRVVAWSSGRIQSVGTSPVGPNASPKANPKPMLTSPAPIRKGVAQRNLRRNANLPWGAHAATQPSTSSKEPCPASPNIMPNIST